MSKAYFFGLLTILTGGTFLGYVRFDRPGRKTRAARAALFLGGLLGDHLLQAAAGLPRQQRLGALPGVLLQGEDLRRNQLPAGPLRQLAARGAFPGRVQRMEKAAG